MYLSRRNLSIESPFAFRSPRIFYIATRLANGNIPLVEITSQRRIYGDNRFAGQMRESVQIGKKRNVKHLRDLLYFLLYDSTCVSEGE